MWAVSLERLNTGNSIDARMPMMAMTTSNSINVNALSQILFCDIERAATTTFRRTLCIPRLTESWQVLIGGQAVVDGTSATERLSRPTMLVSPKVLKPLGRKFCITDSMPDVSVTEKSLNCTGVLPVIRKLVTTRVAQHVRVNRKL